MQSRRRTPRPLLVALATGVLFVCAASAGAQATGKSIFDDDDTGLPSNPPARPATPSPQPPPRLTPRGDSPPPPPAETSSPPPPTSTETKPDASPLPSSRPAKFPVPAAADLAAGQKLVREAFAAEYARTGLADKGNLARALLREVPGNVTDGPTLYVLLRDARDLATAGGDVEAALVASARMGEAFALGDEKAAKAEQRTRLLVTAKVAAEAPPAAALPQAHARRAAELVMRAAEEERSAGYYASAAQLAAQAEPAARKFGDAAFTARVHARVVALQAMSAEAEPVRRALATLKTAPDDPAANLTAGAFYALLLDRFDLGLPRLSKCDDVTVKAAAAKDLAAGDDPRALTAAADAWVEAAKARPPAAAAHRDALQRRALALYERAAAAIEGLEAALVRKRANELRGTRLRRGGLVGEYFAGRGPNAPGEPTLTRIDPAIEFAWRGAPPDPSMPAENFSVRWTGFIKPAAGEYTLIAAHDDSVKVWIGNLLVFDFRDNGVRQAKVKFDGTATPILIEYEQRGGGSKMGLGWQPSAGARPRGVPSEMLWYDPPAPGPLRVAPLADLAGASSDATAAAFVAPGVPAGPPGTITLTPERAELHGAEMRVFVKPDRSAIGHWHNAGEWVAWETTIPTGEYELFLTYTSPNDRSGAEYTVIVGPNRINNTVEGTGGSTVRRTISLGKVKIPTGGKYSVQVRAVTAVNNEVMGLAYLELRPAK